MRNDVRIGIPVKLCVRGCCIPIPCCIGNPVICGIIGPCAKGERLKPGMPVLVGMRGARRPWFAGMGAMGARGPEYEPLSEGPWE